MSIIITLIVWLIVLGLLYYLVTLLPLPHPFGIVVQVLFVLLLIFIVLNTFGLLGGTVGHIRL